MRSLIRLRAIGILTGLMVLSSHFGVLAQDSKPKPIEVAKLDRPKDKKVSFINEVIEILDNKCTGCHNDALAENGLKLETLEQMLKGGKGGPAILAGKADQSLLFQMGSHRLEPVMPPKEKKDLKSWTPEETALIKLWIDEGAIDDSDSEMPEKPKPAVVLNELPLGFAPVYAMDLSQDERFLAVGRGAQLHLVEPVTGFVIATLGGHKDAIQSVRIRPDGQEVAAGSYAIATRWSLPKADLKKNWEKMPFETVAMVNEPGTSLVWASSAKEPKLRLMDVGSSKEVRQIQWKSGLSKFFSRSSFEPVMAILDDAGVVHIHQSEKGEEQQVISAATGLKFTALAWIAKGKIALGRSDGQLIIYEVKGSGKDGLKLDSEMPLSQKKPVSAIFSGSDAQKLTVLIEDQQLELLDISSKKVAKSLAIPDAKVTAIVVDSKDGNILVGQANGVVRRISSDLNIEKSSQPYADSPVTGLVLDPKSATTAVSIHQNGLTRRLDLNDLLTVWAWNSTAASSIQPPSAPCSVVMTPDGDLIVAIKENTWKIWTYAGQMKEKPALSDHIDRVLAIDYSPDSKKMITTGGQPSRSGEVKIWDVESGQLEKSLDSIHSDTVFGVRYSHDGKFFATCAADKFAKVTQLSDFKTLRPLEGHTNHVLGLDWKPDGKQIATAGADQALKLWNVETGEQVRTAQQAGKQITAVRWLAAKPLIVGTSGDKLVRFWNPDNGQISRTFSGADTFLFAVCASKDGSCVYSAGQNGIVQVWNGNDGKLLRKIEFQSAVKSIASR